MSLSGDVRITVPFRGAICALLFTALLTETGAAAACDTERRPNFVIILTDDQGYQDLGCFGSSTISTPRIDQMADEGIRLTDFYAQAVCGPSRAALLTGCYPIRVAEPGNRKNQHTILHPHEVTLAEQLQQHGYATACIGKWHLGRRDDDGWDSATMPNGQGFDEYFGTPLFNGITVRVDEAAFRSPLLRNQQVVKEAITSWDSITRDYTGEAVEFIRRNQSQPFLLYLAHNMPHIPLGASEPFRGRSAYGPYGDAIEEIDWSTGRILDTLRELNLSEQTLVVFTSDNGPWIETTRGMKPDGQPFIPAEHSGTADPLRGYKMLTWEGGLRVPAVAWWPGTIPAGSTTSEVAATIDLFPTLAAFADVPLPDDRVLDGRDIRTLLIRPAHARSPHRETGFFYYRYTTVEAVRSGPWKLVLPRPEHPSWTGWSGRFHGSQVAELSLFNLDRDIAEQDNVADANPEIMDRLQRLIASARADLGDYDRVGSGARFFDDGPHRPDRWNAASATARSAILYDNKPPVGALRFTFEDGDLQGWSVIEGQFGSVVADRDGLPNHRHQPFNKQGRFLLFTGHRDDRLPGDDSFTGMLESPEFELTGDRMSFLVGGGADHTTRVALVDADDRECRTASGGNDTILRRVEWDVKELRGSVLRLRIVDHSRSGWGHVTFDDFSCSGSLLPTDRADAAATETSAKRQGREVPE